MNFAWRVGGLAVALCWSAAVAPPAVEGQGSETAAVITEIKLGRGRVEVKAATAAEWRPARPLQALRAGDAVRASDDATTVILLTGGRGSVRVGAAASPFAVPGGQGADGRGQKARALIEASVGFLTGAARESGQAALSTRGGPRPPEILTPRNGLVLPDALVFEWRGSRFSRYTVRVVGPAGAVVERSGVTGASWSYPPDAPRLVAGVRYIFEVIGAQRPQQAWFELLDATRAQALRADLVALEQDLGGAVSLNSVAVMRAGFLARQGLLHDARLAIVAALARDPDEPTLHLLLGKIYASTGLADLAAESHDEAQFLLKR